MVGFPSRYTVTGPPKAIRGAELSASGVGY